MRYLIPTGILILLFIPLVGCSTTNSPINTDDGSDLKSESNVEDNIGNQDEKTAESADEEEQNFEQKVDPPSKTRQDKVSPEEMEHLKATLRTYIFEEYMPSSDYVYAKGVNWSKRFYDNLTAEEIWNVITEFKESNSGDEGTLFEQASYLSRHAPIKDNWEELFKAEWNDSYLAEFEIDTLVDNGDTALVYVDELPYTGEEDNYPFVTLDKRTGYWHG